MRAKVLVSILAGVTLAAVIVVAYRANELRFRALQREFRAVAEESRQGRAREADRPVYMVAAPRGTATAPTPEAPAKTERQATDADESADQARNHDITEEEQAAHVDMVFSAETTDRAWAHPTERSIGGGLLGVVEGSTLDKVECRNTLCKASLRHPDQTKFSDFLDRVVARASELWKGPIYSYRESVGPDGIVQNSIYFAKQGHSIPSPE